MAKFKVLGEEGADVDVLGEVHKAGDVIDVSDEQSEEAATAVADGKLEATTEDSGE